MTPRLPDRPDHAARIRFGPAAHDQRDGDTFLVDLEAKTDRSLAADPTRQPWIATPNHVLDHAEDEP